MSLKKKSNIFRTVAVRLTIWYAAFFMLSLIAIFVVSKSILSSNLTEIIDQNLFLETQEFDKDLQEEGLDRIKESIYSDAEEQGLGRAFYRLLSSNLEEISSSDLSKWKYLKKQNLREWAKLSTMQNAVYRTIVSSDNQSKARVISRTISNGKYVLQIGKIVIENKTLLDRYNKIFGGVIIMMLLCGVTLGWLAIKKTMEGVKRITVTALRIGRDGFDHRVQAGNEGEEIDCLAEAFNNMLDRIEGLMQEIRDVTNNVAHDLRTPITRIRGHAETTLQNKESLQSYREGYEIIVEECDRLVHLINTILEISETDAGLKKFNKTKIELVDLVKRGFELFLPVAEDKGIQLTFKGLADPIYVLGDVPRLQRIVSNLLDNALKFTKKNGSVLVEARKTEENAEISVQDTGTGIDSVNLTRIFEKFYRVESSRSTPGSGLGLSWVKSIVTSMGWSIDVHSSPHKGSTFVIKIPLKTQS